jgi:transposase-like protein
MDSDVAIEMFHQLGLALKIMLRGEDSIAELCRREGIVQNLCYRWSKDFLEAGKKRLAAPESEA